ncbi:MAG: hypothetical protein KJO49_14075, partial [Bacteroidia bacterium]|nr:hypothetical protein [Bacteroidia bacterium]
LLKKGYQNWYLGRLKCIHYKGESSVRNKVYLKRFYGAMHIFYKKHFKPNPLFNVMVKLGISLLPLIRKEPKTRPVELKKGLFFGKQLPEGFSDKDALHYDLSDSMVKPNPHTKAVYEAEHFSFEEIITQFEQNASIPDLMMMIKPSDARFMVGSHDRNSRGAVESF